MTTLTDCFQSKDPNTLRCSVRRYRRSMLPIDIYDSDNVLLCTILFVSVVYMKLKSSWTGANIRIANEAEVKDFLKARFNNDGEDGLQNQKLYIIEPVEDTPRNQLFIICGLVEIVKHVEEA